MDARLARLALALLPVALGGCRSDSLVDALPAPEAHAAGALPRPTEHTLDEGAEARHKAERRAWMRAMHRTAPGVDWQAIERENGRREMARRAALAASGSTNLGLSSWSEVGSRNQAGRMHWAALSPGGQTLYGASALGGVWRAAPDGTGWTPLGDNLYGGSRLLLAVPGLQPGDPEVLLSATSDHQLRLTRDGGASWIIPPGLPQDFASIRGLERLADGPGTILVAGRSGGLARLYASVDGGLTFQERWTSGLSGPPSMFVPRYGAAAASEVWLLHGGRLFHSVNGAQGFSTVATIASATDGVLVGSEAGAPTLYASLRVGGDWALHRSDDAGQTWSQVNGLANYWRALEVSSVDPQLVVYGGVDCWRSVDGGATFQRVNGWGEYYADPANKLHADVQGLVCLPEPGLGGLVERWYVATDGGLYESLDGLQSVSNLSLSGLGVSQYYSTLSSSVEPSRVAVGSQDQGYQLGVVQPSMGPGPSTDLAQLISGDYGHLTSSDGSHGLVYSTYPGFILAQEGETEPILRTIAFPPGETSLWLPPVVADPLDAGTFYFLGTRLWRYERVAVAGWSREQYGEASFTAGGSGLLSAMAFAPTDPERVYAVNTAGYCFSSTDHGLTWQVSGANGPNSHYFYGNALAVHPARPTEAFVGGAGYSGAGVWRTTDGGQTWQPEASGLPSTLVYDLAFAADGSGDVYAATEAGAYQWDRSTGSWQNIMEPGTPLTLYWSVEAVPEGEVGSAVMRFGTYGRGIWDYRIPAGTNGTWTVYGEGLGGANSLTLASATAPNLGNVVRFTVDGAQLPGSGARWLLAGRKRGQLPFAGGVQLVDQVLRLFPLTPAGTGPAGLDRFAFQLTLPNSADWIGATIRFQGVVEDAASPSGTALSNGLEAVFGL